MVFHVRHCVSSLEGNVCCNCQFNPSSSRWIILGQLHCLYCQLHCLCRNLPCPYRQLPCFYCQLACLYCQLPYCSSIFAGSLVVECSLTVYKVMGSIPAGSYLKTVKFGTRCLSAKHLALKGRIEVGVKWCKNQGLEKRPPYRKVVANATGAFGSPLTWRSTNLLTNSSIFNNVIQLTWFF